MKKLSILVLAVLVSICFISCIQSNQENSNIRENIDKQDQGIYILYKDGYSRVRYLTSGLEKISDIKVKGGWDLCSNGKGKLYVSIAGNASFGGDSVKVIEDGAITKTIDLTYDLPLDIKYNKYNEKAYVTHKYKLTFANENCISIIDTLIDKEIDSFFYDGLIEDITFSSDDKMYIASQNIETFEGQIDVVNLNSNEIEKHIVVDVPLTSIEYSEATKMLYGVSDRKESPILYIADCKDGTVSSLTISNNNPYKLVLDNSEERPLLYISSVYTNKADEGHIITIYDLTEQKEINKIENINGLHDFIIDKDNIYASARFRNRIYKVNLLTNERIEKDIPFPFSISE